MMSASTQGKVLVACPHCGHRQAEPRTGISTVCRKCRGHFQLQDVLNPAPKPVERAPERRKISCFDCGAELEVAPAAESTMCKRCGRYVDLKDYRINNAVAKNFKTKGSFVVELKGYVFNTEVVAREAVIKGRFHGKLFAERLTFYSTADVKGSFKAGCLMIPIENHFRWKEPIQAGSAEIAGELAADLHTEDTVIVKASGRLFGNIKARHLIVEPGAVLVGQARIGFFPEG